MTDPDDTIEPVEGVKGNVARSKDLVATTTEDLKQHHRWLKGYLASEKRDRDRHLRRLRPLRRRPEQTDVPANDKVAPPAAPRFRPTLATTEG